MFGKKEKKQTLQKGQQNLSLGLLKEILANLEDAEIVERKKKEGHCFTFIYIRTLINQERMNEALFEPILHCKDESIQDCISTVKAEEIFTLGEAEEQLLAGSVIIIDSLKKQWWSVLLTNNVGRSIETSETETILYGAKDSFSEQLDTNITLIRRRLPVTELKSEKLKVGTLSETTVVLMYMEGITNPEFVSIAKEKINKIDFDLFLDSSQIAAFMEDHQNSVFPQFQQTDRPDVCAYSLGIGKLIILVDNTPFVLIGPVTFFHLFQSPEDYINRWPVASFLRTIRYISFILSITLIPLYVALTTHHYQMLPLQILFVLVESRSKLPFTPFWEALLMLIILEIIKEASLRMPTKSSQTLGVIGGIVVGQAAVEAGFVSKVLIVLLGVSAIASFLVPNYLVTKANTMIQFVFLLLSSFLGVFGIALGMIVILAHLNSLTSLRQPYLAPVAPLYWKDWNDLFIRGPLTKIKTRPDHLHTFQKWRYSKRR
ncbi:spore germination protein [Bacillus infantis]|uniref:Spore germination protein n=1 Tax=Bacillus infantis TaxID=324767 RepID=A0A5D4R771_9BACI|nr:spore germination protein [Bacillus infantis]TYS45628.1 spore germination protein [Bacillus infantis]